MTGRGPWLARAAALTLSLAVSGGLFVRSAGAARAPAGELSIDASLDRDRIAPGEEAVLTVVVYSPGLNLPAVELPPIPGVSVQRVGTAQNFTMVQGRVERSLTSVFRITSRTEGTYPIPRIRVRVGTDERATRPLTLTVTRSASSRAPRDRLDPRVPGDSPAGSPELFVKATVDRPRAFWNQQLVLRLRLYSRVDIVGDVDWKQPRTSGFWTESLGPPRQGRVRVGGAGYDVMEIPIALFPTRTGTLTIGAAQVRCRVARVTPQTDPWSVVDLPNLVEDVTLSTDPIRVVVDPLPPGAPAGFDGAVGRFTLSVRADRARGRAGEPATAHASIRGAGNVSSIRDPEITGVGQARHYVAGSATRIDRSGDTLIGERTTDVAFIADQPGVLRVLPVRFSWFDPEAGRYRTQASDTLTIPIAPGSVGETHADGTPEEGGIPAAPRRRRGPFGSTTVGPPAGSVALLAVSALAYGAALAGGRVRDRRERDPRVRRRRAIGDLLTGPLARAEALASAGSAAEAAAIAEETLRAGIGIRFAADLAGLSRAEAFATIGSRVGGPEEIASLRNLFDSLDRIAYAPPGTRSADARGALAVVAARLDRYREELA